MSEDYDRLERRVEQSERRVIELDNEISRMKEDQKEREVRQLKWGIQALGVIVIGMGGWIWSQIGYIFSLNGK